MVEQKGIKITAKFFATVREITGKRDDTFKLDPKSTVKDFLRELFNRYGEKLSEYVLDDKGRFNENLSILVNGQAANISALDTVSLADGDVVVILPPIGGG